MKFLFLLFLLPTFLYSQQTDGSDSAFFSDKELELSKIGNRILVEIEEVDRLAACQEFIPKLVSTLKKENSFTYPFDSLKNIAIIYSPDSLFRIFSWQLEINREEYRYFGAIQMNKKELTLIPLIDRSDYIQNFEGSSNSSNEWFGALYYNIKAFEVSGETYYLLFGYDGISSSKNSKLIDIMKFEESGVNFGYPLIHLNGGEKLNRFMITYSENSVVTLNFNAHFQKVIYDNLKTVGVQGSETSKQVVPDGTYRGFELKEDGWYAIEKVFDHVYETPPRPNPKSDNNDLFQKPKKQN
jgi:hypothetical protein